jgi:hypothetical protein
MKQPSAPKSNGNRLDEKSAEELLVDLHNQTKSQLKEEMGNVGQVNALFEDPDSTAKEDPDATWRAKEANQGHILRWVAFCGVAILTLLVFGFWGHQLFNLPGPCYPPEAFYIWAIKLSMSTLVFISLAIGLLRFAIKCYGHHNRDTSQTPDSALPALGKFLETLGKSLNNQN